MNDRHSEDAIRAEDRAPEDPGNFKRTPPVEDLEQDPLDSGRHFTSNQVLVGIVLLGSALGAGLALLFL